MKVKQKKGQVLVTGAGGFIGKAVVKKLLEEGFLVLAMVRPGQIVPFETHPNLSILWADILKWEDYRDQVKEVETIVHLAANKYHPKLSYLVNVEGAKNMLRLLDEKKIRGRRIINISSQSTKIKWMGVYGRSKKESDEIIHASAFDWTTIKPSLVYGEDSDSLFQTIAGYARSLPLVPMIGSGAWKLYPVDVDDVAAAIVAAIRKKSSIGKVYDLGCLKSIRFDRLIMLIQKQLGLKKKILCIPFLPGLAAVFVASKIIPGLPIGVDNVLGSNQDTGCKPKKIMDELDLVPRTIEQGLEKYLGINKPLKKKLRVAVVGLGKMGILHLSVLSTLNGVEVVAIIDIDKGLGKTAQSMGTRANFYKSLEEAVKKEKIEAVFICTPNFVHREALQSCLKKKIPCFIEKPVFVKHKDYEDIEKMVKGSLVAAGYFWLYKREVVMAKGILDRKKIGKVKSYRVWLKHSEVFGPKKGWIFTKKLSGGGVLMNPGPHAFSLITHFFGLGKIEEAKIKHLYGNEVEDEAKLSLTHGNGVTGTLAVSWSVPNYPVMVVEFEILGTNGYIKFQGNKLKVKEAGRREKIYEYHELPVSKGVFNLNPRSGGEAYFLEDKAFVEAVLDGKKLVNSLSFARKTELMISKAYEKAI